MSLLQKWIEYSRDTYLDGETEEVISEMKRKVARRRWRRAIWAVRFNCRLSGGKHIKFEKEPTEPDARQPNDSIDMDFITKIEKDEPKYFHKGSVLHNLIESGVEVVWLSNLTPNDVVYGICVQRELKKVTVVFRGTVRIAFQLFESSFFIFSLLTNQSYHILVLCQITVQLS